MVLSFDNENNRDIIIGNYGMSNNINIERGSSAGDFPKRGRIFFNNGSCNSYTNEDIYPLNEKILIGFAFDKANSNLQFLVNRQVKAMITSEKFSENYDFKSAWIGRDQRNGVTCLKGKINTIRIYNRLLTADEILTNFNIDKEKYNI